MLIVNDRKNELLAFEAALAPLNETVFTAASGAQALEYVREHDVAVVVLDIRMPGMDGFETARALREVTGARFLAILFVSASSPSPELLQRVYAFGGVDFLPAPVVSEALQAKVSFFLDLYRKNKALKQLAAETTEHARAEIARQQERLRLFMEATTDYGLLFMDPDGLVTEWTHGAERVTGFSAADALGQPAALFFTPEDRAAGAPEQEMAVAREQGHALDERWHVRKDGSRFFASGRLIALRDASGELRAFAKIVRDATEMKQSALAVQESLASFRTLANNMSQLAWMAEPDGYIFWYNQRWFDYTGTTLEEMKGWGWRSLHHPDHLDEVVRTFQEALRTGTPWEWTFPLRGKDGRFRWFLSRAVPVRDDHGRILRWFGTNTDIDDTVRAQQSLRESEEKYREIFETASEGIWVLNADACIEIVNRRMADMLGYTVDEMIGHFKTDFVAEADAPRVQAMFEQRKKGLPTWDEVPFRHRNGQTVWTFMSARPRIRNGQFLGALDMFTDITARKAAERELAEKEAQLRLVVEAADVGTFFHEPLTGKDVWNHRNRELLGVPADAVPSTELFLSRVHPEDRARIAQKLGRITSAEGEAGEFRLHYRVVWPDGSVHHLEAAGVTFLETTPAGPRKRVVGAVRDVTESKRFETELQSQVAQRTTDLTEKTAQLEAFVYTVAHDLRSPLRAIGGYADFLAQDLGAQLGADHLAYVEKIKSAAHRMDVLIKDLLGYSRIAQVEIVLEPVSLDAVVDRAMRQLQDEIRRRDATVEIASPLPVVRGERSVLEQVIVNLVSNAIKFVAPGVRPHVRIRAEERDGTVRLAIADNGIGVPERHHGRIFRVFERLRDAGDYPGTGVGLAIVAKGIERLGGTVGVSSQAGAGSTFWFELSRIPS